MTNNQNLLAKIIKEEKINVTTLPESDEKIVLTKGCLKVEHIYLERIATDSPKDSGWFIGYAEKEKNDGNYEAILVSNLLKTRPMLTPILQLPPGFLIIVDNDEIDYIDNEKHTTVYTNPKLLKKS